MMASIVPSKEFKSPTVSWKKENLTSFLSRRYRSESSPPIPQRIKNEQHNPLSKKSQVKDTISSNIVTNEFQQSTSNLCPNNDRKTKYSSQSLIVPRKIDVKNLNEQQQPNLRSANVNFIQIRRFPESNIIQSKENSTHTLPERNHSERPLSLSVATGQTDIPLEKNLHIKNVSSLNSMSNEDLPSSPTFHSENSCIANYRLGSFSSLKNVDEKEQKDQLSKTIKSKRYSIHSSSKQFSHRKKPSISIGNNRINSMIPYLPTEDLTLLNPTINENQHSTSNVHATKYSFQSSDSTTPIYGKQRNNNHQHSCCYKVLGCLFVMTACSLGIAALIFALISYRSTLSETSITTTTSTTATSTTSTTTTTTTTTTHTTTSTSTITTTSTSTTTTTTTSTSATTMCSATQMTTRLTITPLPSQCFTYMEINDFTRHSSYSGGLASCDQTFFSSRTWVRFTGASGTSLANCPVTLQSCGANVTGWYSGVYPAIAGEMTEGVVCYNWAKDTCSWQTIIQIINCNGYYVYELSPPPVCIARYCTI